MKKPLTLIFTLCFTLLLGWGQVYAAGTTPNLEVEHSMQGKSIDLYFTVKNFTLAQGKGCILLTLDGRPMKVYSNQKRISGLTAGPHKIKAELEQSNGSHPGMTIEFEVNIP